MKRILLIAIFLAAPAAADPNDKAHQWLETLRQGDPPIRDLYDLVSQPLTPALYKKCETDYLEGFAAARKRMQLLKTNADLGPTYSAAVRDALISASTRQDESAGMIVGVIYMRRRLERPREPIGSGPKIDAQAPGLWDTLKQPQAPTATQMAAAKKEARDFQIKYDVDYKRAESLILEIDSKGGAKTLPKDPQN